MAELPQYQRTILRQTQETDMSEANVWKTLAAQMDNFSSQIGAYAQQDTARKSRSAAAAKSAQNDLRLSNERATKVYVDGKESDVMTSLSQLSIDFSNDYEGYIQAANNLQKTWLENKELDAVGGMRAAFTTMVTNKIQQYGVDPYKVFSAKQKQEGKRVGVINIKDFVTDANHQVSQFIDSVYDGSIETLDDPDNYAKQVDMVAGKYMTLQAKIEDLIKVNDYTADEAIALESQMELKFFSGVIQSQLNNEIKSNNGWKSIAEFKESPTKFIRSRAHLSALIPEGVKINDVMADSIYTDLLSYYKESVTQREKAETIAEEDTLQIQSDNYSEMLYSLVDPETNIDDFTVRQMLKDGDINNEQHDSLIKAIGQSTYVKDNPQKVFDLNRQILNPQGSYQDKEQAITDAFLDGDIDATTATAMLTKASTASDVTKKPYFQRGWNAIESGLVEDVTKRTSNEGEVVNLAQEEFYKRVQGYTDDDGKYYPPEDGIAIYQEIVDKYKPLLAKTKNTNTERLPYYDIDTKIGASFAEMEFDKTTGWNTFFVGTPEKVQAFSTKVKVGELVESGAMSEKDAAKILNQLKNYVVSLSEED